MAFEKTQDSYMSLREILAERTSQVVVFCGAGLSAEANLPSWTQLKEALVDAAKRRLALQPKDEIRKELALLEVCQHEKDLWVTFKHLKEILGSTSFDATIREKLSTPAASDPPQIYARLWRLPISGYVSLNLDGLVSRAFASVYGGRKVLREFCGVDCGRHPDLFASGGRFVVNLHGALADVQSWVLTSEDRDRLLGSSAYLTFLTALFATKTVLFIGVSADDAAIAVHLKKLRDSGFSGGRHFWVTHRTDAATARWADENKISPIYYSTPDRTHREVLDFLTDIENFLPADEDPLPVSPSTPPDANFVILPPEQLEKLTAEEIRQALNKEATRILGSGAPDRFKRYASFWEAYAESIHRAWSVSTSHPRDIFMGYRMRRNVTKGGFGTIYEAEDSAHNICAVKVLHNASKEDERTLQAFRRGVRAMRILSERKVDGMVPYLAAWEIPPCAVMEFIDGANLHEAVQAGKISDWDLRLRIGRDLTRIILDAHGVPERVLHRDIRPANIMLEHFWEDPYSSKVFVLDFDLSWHRDATGDSVVLTNSINGFLAPEQLGEHKSSTRSALVDSYGLGMTFYFLATGSVPLVAASLHADWEQKLKDSVVRQKDHRWKSLPARFARLISWATRPLQNERWDPARIHGELILLSRALSAGLQGVSAEILAEEILARTKEISRLYVWDVDRICGIAEFSSGFVIKLSADESTKSVSFACDWMNTGVKKFENVKKYVGPACERMCATLKQTGWKIDSMEIGTDRVRVTGGIWASRITSTAALGALAAGLDEAVETLKLGSIS